ncbi:MAG: AbrB/MazE/SpoVT family DNA-binding domain-containing protein [Pseudomonadota bacterium]
MRVAKWGNSLAVRIPAGVAEVMDLKEGDEIDIRVTGPRALELVAKPDIDAMFERLRSFRGRLPADFKFDREEANSRG